MSSIFAQLEAQLVVSCQASPGDPLDDTDALRRIALAAIGGGAAGLRVNSAEHIAALRRDTSVPIIGIQKQYGRAGLRITPDFAAAARLAAAGASIIALDCTDRTWPGGDPWPQLIARIHQELKLPVMADVATLDDAVRAVAAGADCVGPTLHGYTEGTRGIQSFNWELLTAMNKRLAVPIMAEGHIFTPAEARRAMAGGAWCVIVGSAITRPGVIAARFARAIERWRTPGPIIGVDIGGTSIKAGLVASSGEISCPMQVATAAGAGREAITAGFVATVEQVLKVARAARLEPAGIGIATAGAVDSHNGSIFAATDNLPGWTGFPLAAFAREHFHLPTAVVNDAQAAALSELYFGVGRELDNFVTITIGTGVGGGIVCDGKLLKGEHGFAGTVGHHALVAGGRPCNCGRRGCLEAYVSTAALLREYRENGGILTGVDDNAERVLLIKRLAKQGDTAARKAYATLADYLAEGITNVFNLLDPQAVLLGGGLIEGHQDFVQEVETRVRALLPFGAHRHPRVQQATAGRFAGLQGATTLVFDA